MRQAFESQNHTRVIQHYVKKKVSSAKLKTGVSLLLWYLQGSDFSILVIDKQNSAYMYTIHVSQPNLFYKRLLSQPLQPTTENHLI